MPPEHSWASEWPSCTGSACQIMSLGPCAGSRKVAMPFAMSPTHVEFLCLQARYGQIPTELQQHLCRGCVYADALVQPLTHLSLSISPAIMNGAAKLPADKAY